MRNILKQYRIAIIAGLSVGILLICSLIFSYARGVSNSSASSRQDSLTNNQSVFDMPPNKLQENNAGTIPAFARGLHVPILMYHHVGGIPADADAVRRSLTVNADLFELEVSWLAQQGYGSITLHQVFLATQQQLTLPAKPIVFTFDDGYRDAFEVAVPILKKYGFVGSFAVMPGFVGTSEYASWDEIIAAKEQGMEIISHTYDHFDGGSSNYSQDFIKHNLELSLAELDMRLDSRVPRILIYPYGHYTSEYIEIAKQAGFVMALTTAYGQHADPENLMRTPRIRVHGGESLDIFIEKLLGKKR